jgi:hypothetical protein
MREYVMSVRIVNWWPPYRYERPWEPKRKPLPKPQPKKKKPKTKKTKEEGRLEHERNMRRHEEKIKLKQIQFIKQNYKKEFWNLMISEILK